MNILLTGGTGYIGSHLATKLLQQGHQVILYDNLSNSFADIPKKINQISNLSPIFVKGDMLDASLLKETMLHYQIELVFHLAAAKSLFDSLQFPLQYYQNNLVGSLNLFQIMSELKIYKLIFSSSSSVYAAQMKLPIEEEALKDPISPYGKSKYFIEQILLDLIKTDFKWQIYILRYFNVAGAHPSGLLGEIPSQFPSNILPNILSVASQHIPYLNIYGDDYPTLDGTTVRDYIHIMDLVEAHILAMAHLGWERLQVCNLGSSKGYSILQLIDIFTKVTGITIPYRINARRYGDAPFSLANIDRAKVDLGFEVKQSIEDICRSAWNFQMQQTHIKT